MKIECKICKINNIEKHPHADNLSIISLDNGKKCIIKTFLKDTELPRFHLDDLVVFIPESAVLPYWLLKELDLWNDDKNKGLLYGANGNQVKAIKIKEIISEGLLYPVYEFDMINGFIMNSNINSKYFKEDSFIKIPDRNSKMQWKSVNLNDNVSEILGIS